MLRSSVNILWLRAASAEVSSLLCGSQDSLLERERGGGT